MPKQQTAFREAIVWIEERMNTYKKQYEDNGDDLSQNLYAETMWQYRKFQTLLPKERQQIEEIFEQGYRIGVHEYSSSPDVTSGSDYFTNNFEQ